jgi:transposase
MKLKAGRPRQWCITPEVAEQLRLASKAATKPRDKERLHAGLLAAQGVLSLDQIAQAVGRARSCVQTWLNNLSNGGVAGLLARKSPPGVAPALNKDQEQQLREQIAQGHYRTAKQLSAWIKEQWGVELQPGGIYYWLGKFKAVLRVARPQHRRHDEQKAAEFKFNLGQRLHGLNLPRDRPVKIWVQDEGRYGLHSFTRRVWTLPGIKPVVPVQQAYRWFYVFAALECTQGDMQVAYWDSVDLDITRSFLEQIATADPGAEHVIIYDGAGFHLKAPMHVLPAHVHVITLPAYSPELNPVEGLWDSLRDEVCNQVFDSLADLQQRLTPALAERWQNASKVMGMVHGWIKRSANVSSPNIIPVFN